MELAQMVLAQELGIEIMFIAGWSKWISWWRTNGDNIEMEHGQDPIISILDRNQEGLSLSLILSLILKSSLQFLEEGIRKEQGGSP
jgi:hypothetical protein